MRDAIYALLAADFDLKAQLPGGIYGSTEDGVAEIDRQDTPDAFAGNEVRPCALLKMGSLVPFGPFGHSARQHFSVMLYQRRGVEAIDAARRRIYELLHRRRVAPIDDSSCWQIEHDSDVLDAQDDALDGCRMQVCRFYAIVGR
jgi:hypothetical protein